MPDDFMVHDVQLSERVGVSSGGTISRKKVLTFYIGVHGPFMREFTPEEYSAERGRAAIDGEVAGLRVLTQSS